MPIKFTSSIDVSSNRIVNVGAPTAGTDAVTKNYVDSVATGLVWKDAVRAAAVVDVDLTNPGAVDGVTLADGDRVLLMGQNDPAENGIYTFTGGALQRAGDADSAAELRPGSIATVSEGAGQGNKTYVLITDGPITLGTSPLTWTLANNNTAPVYVGGDGIAVDGGTHEITVTPATNGGISVGGSGISVVAAGDGGLSVGADGIEANVGDGLDVNGSNELTVVAMPDAGLIVDGTGVGIMLDRGTGLYTDAGGLWVQAWDGIAVDDSGVSVKPDPAGAIDVDSDGVKVVANGDAGIVVDADGVAVKLAADKGLSVDVDGIAVKIADERGLAVDADGLGVVTAPNMGIENGRDGLEAVLANSGGLEHTAQGTAIKLATDSLLTVGALGVAVDQSLVCRRYSTTVGNGTDAVIQVAHNLNTRQVGVEVISTAAPYDTVFVGVTRPDSNTVELDFGSAPASGAYDVLVWG